MIATAKYVPEKPSNIVKNDYLILKDGREGRVVKPLTGPKFLVFIPGETIDKNEKIEVEFKDIENKLVLWAFSPQDIAIAKISNKADFVKCNDVIDGWIENKYFSEKVYTKIFKVKCPHCKRSY
jgi:hypothetical protein